MKYFLTPLADRVAMAVMQEERAPFFRDRLVEETDLVTEALLMTLQHLSGVLATNDPVTLQLVAQEIITLLYQCAGATAWGNRPFGAADPILLQRGEQIGKDRGCLYMLAALGKVDQLKRIPGGFLDSRGTAYGDGLRELWEEVLSGNHVSDSTVRMLAAVSGDPSRATDRWLKSRLHIVSLVMFCLPRRGVVLKPKAASDAGDWTYVKVVNEDDELADELVGDSLWRDDHYALICSALQSSLTAYKARRRFTHGRRDFYGYLESLPEVVIPEPGFSPTPESTPPETHNVLLARRLVSEILVEHSVSRFAAQRIAEAIIDELVRIHFVPYYSGPDVTLDNIVVGTGKRSDRILLLLENNKAYLPGVVWRHGENLSQAAIRGLAKAGVHAKPYHLATLAPEWIGMASRLRDKRGTSAGVVLIDIASALQDTKVPHLWLPLYDAKGRLSEELLRLDWLHNHQVILADVATKLVEQGVYRPGREDLRSSIIRRGLRP